MKQMEKIISGLLTVVLGILLIVLKGEVISIIMTVLGVGLLLLGAVDLYNKRVPPAVVKLVLGIVIIFFGWVFVKAVLYLVAAALLITGILMLYEQIRHGDKCATLWQNVCRFATPIVFLLIGGLLLFNQGGTIAWIFILSGIFTIIEGGVLLLDAFLND